MNARPSRLLRSAVLFVGLAATGRDASAASREVVCTGAPEVDYGALQAAVGAPGRVTLSGGLCVVPSDLQVSADDVRLACDPGSGVQASESGRFARAMVEVLGQRVGIVDCHFDLNGQSTAAVAGTEVRGLLLRGNRVEGGGESAEPFAHVDVACGQTNEECAVIDGNRIHPPARPGASSGIRTDARGGTIRISRNVIRGVGRDGIGFGGGRSFLSENDVEVSGDRAVGIRDLGKVDASRVSSNVVRAEGQGAHGFRVVSLAVRLSDNHVELAGPTGVAYATEAPGVSMTGNAHVLGTGCSNCIGVDVASGFATISGHAGNAQRPGSNTHMVLGRLRISGQIQVSGAFLRGARRGIVTGARMHPDVEDRRPLNYRISGSTLHAQGLGGVGRCAGIVLATGAHVVGNTISWSGSDCVNISVGAESDPGIGGSRHSVVTGNSLQCKDCQANVWFSRTPRRCDISSAATAEWRSCEADVDCDGGSCRSVLHQNITIVGNMLMGTCERCAAIDMGSPRGATGPTISNVTIEGNTFLQAGSTRALVRLPREDLARNVVFGDGNTWKAEPSEKQEAFTGNVLDGWRPQFGRDETRTRSFCGSVRSAQLGGEYAFWSTPSDVEVVGVGCICQSGAGDACDASAPLQLRFGTRSGRRLGKPVSCLASDEMNHRALAAPVRTGARGTLVTVEAVDPPPGSVGDYLVCLLFR